MPTHNPIGLATVSGVSLPQNPVYSHSWRDASSTHRTVADATDMFAVDPNPRPQPWVAEFRQQFQAPAKYAARVRNMTLVHTGGLTQMAHTTHHTVNAVSLGGTLYRGLQQDAAFDEEVVVAQELQDRMPLVIEQCQKYHLHSPDGWISSAGFVVSARKAGVPLTRTQFLALERAVPKDTLGRVNYYQIHEAVERLVRAEPPQ